jgi:hypothetical protein
MLRDLSHEEYLIKYNKFPKTKYLLQVNGKPFYEFTTTSRGEDESVSILKQKIKEMNYISVKYYKIISEKNGEKKLLYSGKI